MRRPVIGISSYVEAASWRAWREVRTVLVPHRYVQHVQDAGGIAFVVPPLPLDATEDDARELLSHLDGLILAGGVDIAPALYGAIPHPAIQASRPDRDHTELFLARLTAADDMPVLGICRGMQMMAVAAGGSLEQHLPDRLGHDRHSPAPGVYGEHDVQVDERSRLHEILDARVAVATYHHQGVASHPGYTATAWSDDGLVEAFEDPDKRFRLGIQWHPEVGTDPRLFEALVASARR
jgi:putative glutamine amidotransferase